MALQLLSALLQILSNAVEMLEFIQILMLLQFFGLVCKAKMEELSKD